MSRSWAFGMTLLFLVASSKSEAQIELGFNIATHKAEIAGSVIIADTTKATPFVLLISGSGPTDRDGNNLIGNGMFQKMLADSLAENGISSLRYDKRGVGESTIEHDPKDIKFDWLIDDAVAILQEMIASNRFSKVFIAGHSQGSLLGMVAAQQVGVDGFISLAGPGDQIINTIEKQINNQSQELGALAAPKFDSLKQGLKVKNDIFALISIFNVDLQQFLIDYHQYDPSQEIAKLENLPTLIVQGTTDLQVLVEDAQKLKEGNSLAQLLIIEGMNHSLKNSSMDRQENLATYADSSIPINSELVAEMVRFINSN